MSFQNVDWAVTGAFWSGVGSMLAGIGSLIAAIAIVKTYLKARNSIDEWKAQEQFKEDRKLAIEALAAFEEGKQAIKSIRSPFSPASEQSVVEAKLREAEKDQGTVLTEGSRQKHMKRLTVQMRGDRHIETWTRLLGIMPITKAVFGSEAHELLFEILRARHEVCVAADMFNFDLDFESTTKFDKIIWEFGDDGDKLSKRLTTAEEKLTQILIPYIRPVSTPTAPNKNS